MGSIVGRWAERAVTFCKALFLAIASLLLVASAIAPVRKRLQALGVFDDEVMNEAIGIAFILTVALMELIYRQMKQMKRMLAAGRAPLANGSEVLKGGVGNVYPHLLDTVRKANSRGEHSLEVLGLTLYTAWPQVEAWVAANELNGWTIVLHSLAPNFVQSNSELPATWAPQSQGMIESIRAFVDARKDELGRRKIALSVNAYAGFPAVHGFRVGREILISFSQWNSQTATPKLDTPTYFYERFGPDDQSHRAEAYRSLFANWISHAERSSGARYSTSDAANATANATAGLQTHGV